jgi:hypothetical protein
MNAEELTAAIFHRPLRGAWLIDEANVASGDGAQVFSELAQACCRWWEGRNSLLIRVATEALVGDEERILRHHDPDELISLTPLSKKIIEDV